MLINHTVMVNVSGHTGAASPKALGYRNTVTRHSIEKAQRLPPGNLPRPLVKATCKGLSLEWVGFEHPGPSESILS